VAGHQDPPPLSRSVGQGLPREFFARDALLVARGLLGQVVEHATPDGVVAVRMTEVEAYAGTDDPGSHAYRGHTPRTSVMFGPPGHLYVYFTYGMHWCANVVCGRDGAASAVLLRAGEVVAGQDLARSRRAAARRDSDLARGPARLASALGLDGRANGVDLCAGEGLRVVPGAAGLDAVVRSGPRVGVRGDGGDGARFPWRFWLDGEATVSAYRPGRPRARPGPASGRLDSRAADDHRGRKGRP
jgi:DNA-3-methyladenine glycosylase